MKILFLDTVNGYESTNPIATLVDVTNTTLEQIKCLEKCQDGVYRNGGNLNKILLMGNIPHTILSKGVELDYEPSEYDYKYQLISGNY